MTKRILYVDDDLATGQPRLEASRVPFREKMPVEVMNDEEISRALEDIGVVLMDYDLHNIDHESAAPIDGLELLERFRATIRRHGREDRTAPLLTIYTSELNKLARQHDDCPPVPYMLARRANVDWVFEKRSPDGGEDSFGSWLTAFLDAFDLDLKGCGDEVERQLAVFLKLPERTDWSDLALEQLLDARPPIQSLARESARTLLMRWLLQSALPFPGCFIDLNSVAVRLRMRPAELRTALGENPRSEFATLLSQCEYHGALARCFPNRYWKAGVDHIVWQATQGRSPASPEVRESLTRMIGTTVSLLDESNPVLILSPDTLELTGEVADLAEAVQIQPDLWPSTIESPWIRISEVMRDRKLRAMVVSKDRDRIAEDAS